MVKIRLRRVGAKKQASFRVVVADSRSPRDGRFIEEIGFYNPRTEPETLRIKEERALHWLSVGAQPTDSAARLLKSSGTLERFERMKQGEPLEALVAEAEAEPEEVEEEAPEAVEVVEETAAEELAAEAPMAEAEPEKVEEEAPEAAEEAEEARPEEPAAEAEIEEAEEATPVTAEEAEEAEPEEPEE